MEITLFPAVCSVGQDPRWGSCLSGLGKAAPTPLLLLGNNPGPRAPPSQQSIICSPAGPSPGGSQPCVLPILGWLSCAGQSSFVLMCRCKHTQNHPKNQGAKQAGGEDLLPKTVLCHCESIGPSGCLCFCTGFSWLLFSIIPISSLYLHLHRGLVFFAARLWSCTKLKCFVVLFWF